MNPTIIIEYCPECHWLLRAAYKAQEFLTTFENDLKGVTLQPSRINGDFHISINNKKNFDRGKFGRFPDEIKELTRLVRDIVASGKNLGHTDTKPYHSTS